MKKTLPRDIANYTSISPDKLTSRSITEQEKKLISSFIKKYNRNHKTCLFMTIFIGLFFAFLNIYNGIFDFSVLIACSICFIVAFAISRNLLPSAASCKYIQIGQLYGIWSLKSPGSSNRNYYFNVVFPDSLTHIKNVNCIKKEYSTAKENDYILTFSFDGRSSYGCLFK